jgi:glucokinase
LSLNILAGDIGGTKARLGLFEFGPKDMKAVRVQRFPSREFKSLEEVVEKFNSPHAERVEGACFGIAGPVRDGRRKMPNLGWTIDARTLSQRLGIRKVRVINDVEANAYALPFLQPKDFEVLQDGRPDHEGNIGFISAGTGLGQAGIMRDGAVSRPFASEGGHCDFAPRDELEMDLLRYLRGKFERVSYERIVSGPGLHNIYRFLIDTGRGSEQPEVAEDMQTGDANAVVTHWGLENKDPVCAQALEIFVSVYGAEAGNVALKFMATGGVYLGGGIAPRIISKLKNGTFARSFTQKGRLTSMMLTIPVRVILNDDAALLGAARCAAELAQPQITRSV